MDASFHEEAISRIKQKIRIQREICTKHGYTPEYIRGYITGLEEALIILKAPKMSADEGLV